MRPPYGSINQNVIDAATAHGQNGASFILILSFFLTENTLPLVALWDFDSGDSTGTPPDQSEAMYTNLVNQHPSSILALNHETYSTTAYALTSSSKS